MTTLNRLGVSISKLATEVHKLDSELPLLETKAFFAFRNLDTGGFAPIQKRLISIWEARTTEVVNSLTLEEYKEFREWLGVPDKYTGAEKLPARQFFGENPLKPVKRMPVVTCIHNIRDCDNIHNIRDCDKEDFIKDRKSVYN